MGRPFESGRGTMNTSDMTTFLTTQLGVAGPIFLAGFGAVFGFVLIRRAITRYANRVSAEVGGGRSPMRISQGWRRTPEGGGYDYYGRRYYRRASGHRGRRSTTL